ncbi:metal ABC transporter substrate-binding protein [Arcanobacterium hippocoleae]|uniref:Zinc transport system substrate-binding protein n=1 Tax=Arcanobacterium hippocoleae TaxID=149017 RepID=A0ABU1T283_9ACTO|nr:metal ABC transporter substrate-binding protein [Arcanobacterium hippocoleae]MDR6938986.1 zinc transport system substrate-binding protein [Arcanobacterium hippocoleae]
MKNNLYRLIAVAAAAVYALGACSTTDNSTPSDTSATKLKVTTSFYPLTYLVKEIGGENVSVIDLTPPTGSAHDAEISPAQIVDMEKSDAVFYLATLSAAVDKAVENAAVKNAVNIGESVNLIKQTDIAAFSESLPSVDADLDNQHESETHDEHLHANQNHAEKHEHENEHAHDHEHEHEHEHEHGHDHEHEHEHEHNHGIYDPHFWTDPSRLALAAPVIANTLGKIDNANKSTYEENATAVADKLNTIANEFKNTLSTKQCRTNAFIVTHLAYGYLAAQNNLKQIGIAGFDPDIEPSPARINQIKEAAKQYNIDTIFATSDTEKTVASAVANETGTKVEILDPAATQRDSQKDYIAVMRENFKLLQNSLGCK